MIKQSVGQGGKNATPDVLYAQLLLADWLVRSNQPPIAVDGLCGPKTIQAITAFQKREALFADGRIDPANKTIARLEERHLEGLKSGQPAAAFSGLPIPVKSISVASVRELQQAYLSTLRNGMG